MDSELHIEEQILKCIEKDYKDIPQIAEELSVSRNRVQVHIFKMRKYGFVSRLYSDDDRHGRKGYKFRKAIKYEEAKARKLI